MPIKRLSKLDNAINEISRIDALAKEDRFLRRVHPLIKLIITLAYIIATVSFSKYNISGLLLMGAYPIILFITADLSFKDALRRLRVVLPLVCLIGVFNPIFDREIVAKLFGVEVSGGVLSMISLMIKGVLTVLASYLLIATTPIEDICYALRKIHVPQIIVTEILLIYRYITVFLEEAKTVMDAYKLRAPGQKGIHISAWGSLIGQMLIRAMDRAGMVYESMKLRGFHGEFYR